MTRPRVLSMPSSTPARAALLAAMAALLLYLPALRNDWALDDHGLVERNPAAHSLTGAWHAVFSPYWPPEGDYSAGLYRPITILSYAVDWTISSGRPPWFHLTNAVLHAVATALVVLVLVQWLPTAGALAAGLLFAIHPVHVEAVANVAGRSELLAAIGLLAAVWSARRYRHTAPGPRRGVWLAITVLLVMLALGSKEHAVVAIAVLALDHWLDPHPAAAPPSDVYLAVAAVTVAWLWIWRAIAGGLVSGGAVVPFRDLSFGQRLASVLPVQLDVLRLLVWPMDLAADYSPQTIPIRTQFSLQAGLGAATALAVLLLATREWRRAPAVAFVVLAGVATYLPTSNLFFVSGVVLAERALYFAALAPCAVAGWLLTRPRRESAARRAWLAGAAVVAVVFAIRTVTRIPFWRDSRTVAIESFIEHPENFSNHVRLADVFAETGDSARALAQYLTAGALYDGYSFAFVRAGRLALARGRLNQALELGRRARAISPEHPGPAGLLVDVFLRVGWVDSAVALAWQSVRRSPGNLEAARLYRSTLERAQAPPWTRLAAAARLDWLNGRLIGAAARLDSLAALLPAEGALDCQVAWVALPAAEMLDSLAATKLHAHTNGPESKCSENVR